jgi:transposase
VARIYFARWKIEEYFRSKKQSFQFESFQVRELKTIDALNFHITLCLAFLAMISMKPETKALKAAIIESAAPIKEKVSSAITDWPTASEVYFRMQKKASGYSFGQNARHTVNFALGWSFR